MSAYSEKLRDPRWQRKRLEILNRDGWKCSLCGTSDRQLHVHHVLYLQGRSPWEYPASLLESLCDECHELEHFNSLMASAIGEIACFFRENSSDPAGDAYRLSMALRGKLKVFDGEHWNRHRLSDGAVEEIIDAVAKVVNARREEAIERVD